LPLDDYFHTHQEGLEILQGYLDSILEEWEFLLVTNYIFSTHYARSILLLPCFLLLWLIPIKTALIEVLTKNVGKAFLTFANIPPSYRTSFITVACVTIT
jgi:hypothetical protein